MHKFHVCAWSADTPSGKMLNCKVHISIFREPVSRDFLKHEVLSEQRPATPIQVKGSHKHWKNATNTKHVLLLKKEQNHIKILPWNTKIKLKTWYLAPKTQSQLPWSSQKINGLNDWLPVHWSECCSRNKNCLYFVPLTLTDMIIKEENSETFIL